MILYSISRIFAIFSFYRETIKLHHQSLVQQTQLSPIALQFRQNSFQSTKLSRQYSFLHQFNPNPCQFASNPYKNEEDNNTMAQHMSINQITNISVPPSQVSNIRALEFRAVKIDSCRKIRCDLVSKKRFPCRILNPSDFSRHLSQKLKNGHGSKKILFGPGFSSDNSGDGPSRGQGNGPDNSHRIPHLENNKITEVSSHISSTMSASGLFDDHSEIPVFSPNDPSPGVGRITRSQSALSRHGCNSAIPQGHIDDVPVPSTIQVPQIITLPRRRTVNRPATRRFDQQQFFVTKILDHRSGAIAGFECFTEWLNHGPSENTWEPLNGIDHTPAWFSYYTTHSATLSALLPHDFTPPIDPANDISNVAAALIDNTTHDLDNVPISAPPLDSNILDLPFHQYYQFSWVVPTLTFIPEANLNKVRNCYIFIMKKIVCNPQDIQAWKKLFLLPTVLLALSNSTKDKQNLRSRHRKEWINSRAQKILADDWNSFSFGSLPLKKPPAPLSEAQQETNKQKRVEKLAEAGEIGRAMKTCSSATNNSCPSSLETVEKLQSLHPPPCEYTMPADIRELINNAEVSTSARERLQLNDHKLRKFLRGKPRLVAQGLLGDRWEFFSALVGTGKAEVPAEEEVAKLLTSVIVLLSDVKDVPADIYAYLRINNLVALPKKDGSVRPIGMGSVWRKIISSHFFSETYVPCLHYAASSSFNDGHFKGLQFGTLPRGCETILHSFNHHVEARQDQDTLFADASNAFNSLSRQKGLEETFKYFPDHIPFLREIYLKPSFGAYFGLKQGIKLIPSKEGFHQGCIQACWLFSMAFHPFLRTLVQIVGHTGIVKALVDDTNISATTAKMFEAITHINSEGRKIGFMMNPKKGALLLGRCSSRLEALQKKDSYMSTFGLIDSVIHIHPDNMPGPGTNYGAIVLGSFIGHSAYIQSEVANKCVQLEKVKQDILKVSNKQIQFLMLIWCYSQKLNYIQRTLPHDALVPLLNEYEGFKKHILEHIVDCDIDDKRYQLAQLAIKESGLGLQNSHLISHSAFVASKVEFYADHPVLLNQVGTTQLMCYKKILTSITVLNQYDPTKSISFDSLLAKIMDGSTDKLQDSLSMLFSAPRRSHVMSLFDVSTEKVIVNSFKDDDAGKHLTIAPKSFLHSLPNKVFLSMMRFRLVTNQSNLLNDPCRCTRNRSHMIDQLGGHFATGCPLLGVRIAMHDAVVDTTRQICNYAGYRTKTEQHGIFQGNDFDIGDNSRPDLTVLGCGTRPILLDIRVTSATPPNGGILPARAADDPDHTQTVLEKSYKAKIAHYGQAAVAAHCDFLPCIADIGGQLHPKYKAFLKKIIKTAAETKNIPFSILWNYWISALMVTIQKRRAISILALSANAYGSSLPAHFEMSDQVVSASNYINSY
jgi:hypothetical protein